MICCRLAAKAALRFLMQATGALADLGGPLAPVFGLLSIISFLLIPLELFEVAGSAYRSEVTCTCCSIQWDCISWRAQR
jgi:hypothetical protein